MHTHPSAVALDRSVLTGLTGLIDDIEDADAVRDLVEIYLDRLPGRCAEVAAAQRAGDGSAILGVMHVLGSASLLLGVLPFGELCRVWENDSRLPVDGMPEEGLAEWRRAADDASAALHLWLDEQAGGAEVELTEVEFVDSAGLAALVRLRRTALAAGVPFWLLRPLRPKALRAFGLTGLAQVFDLRDGHPTP